MAHDGWSELDIPAQTGRVAVVMGANLGLETARQLAARGATVVMADRSLDRGAAPLEEPADLGEHASVGVGELGSARCSVQYRDLMAKGDDFGFEQPARLGPHDEQLTDGGEEPVPETHEHELDPGR